MLKHFLILVSAFLLSGTCWAETVPTPQQASALLHQISGAQVRPFSTRDFGREKFNGAISILVNKTKAEALLVAVRKKLPTGFVAFIGTTRSLSKPPSVGVELVIGLGNGPLDILQVAQTDAINYDMQTKDLQTKLAKWNKAYGIDVWQAETDTIQLRFVKMPRNIEAFAKEVYEFCPDIVDQGAGTQRALIQEMQQQKGVTLWWD